MPEVLAAAIINRLPLLTGAEASRLVGLSNVRLLPDEVAEGDAGL